MLDIILIITCLSTIGANIAVATLDVCPDMRLEFLFVLTSLTSLIGMVNAAIPNTCQKVTGMEYVYCLRAATHLQGNVVIYATAWFMSVNCKPEFYKFVFAMIVVSASVYTIAIMTMGAFIVKQGVVDFTEVRKFIFHV